ncbi:MAG: NAD-dependent epimerase/dehydratase family protein [Candidatus Roizmanbacteria bacterium]|nr:NAD-dependent epimerase/dehydratase family protein [Candidatus Roizmanbacteria bacterium]
MKTYFVTGASGFIGSCMVRRLVNEGNNVHILLRPQANLWRIQDILSQVTVHSADFSKEKELVRIIKKSRPSIIYHFAAYGAYPNQQDGRSAIKTNIEGTWNLLKATEKYDYELFVNTGSSSEYGFKDKPMKETDILEPASYYATTKAAQTLMCAYEARKLNKPIVTIRPFSVYGPYEEPTRFMPQLMNCLYSQKTMKLVDPSIARDFIYIDDILDAYMAVSYLQKYPGEVFNIGTGIQSSLETVVQKAFKITKVSTVCDWGSMPKRIWDATTWVADIAKSKKLLQWKPQTSLTKGLLLFWQWYKKNHILYLHE